jgi:hypothetical protein
MNDRTSIYSESYKMAPADKKEILEELRGQKSMADRARKLGLLLKEAKSTTEGLKRKVRTLETENRNLRDVIAKQSREASRRD